MMKGDAHMRTLNPLGREQRRQSTPKLKSGKYWGCQCRKILLLTAVWALFGCSDADDGERLPPGSQKSCVMRPLFLDKDVDLLLVMDNSQSMALGQANLQKNFPKLIEALRTPKLGNVIPNVRIGIVSPDLGIGKYNSSGCNATGGDKGKLHNKAQVAGCTPPTDPWISFTYDPKTKKAVTNIPGFLSTDTNKGIQAVKNAFACIGSIGIDGCGFEQTIQSARRALDPTYNTNPGFLRNDLKKNQDALLAVVFITDEDDCSASDAQLFDPQNTGLTDPLGPWTSFRCFEFGVTCDCGGKPCTRTTTGVRTNCAPASASLYLHKIEDYVTFFQGLKKTRDGKPNPARVIMAAIAGPFTGTVQTEMVANIPNLKPSCYLGNATADPAVRIKALVHAFARELSLKDVAAIKAKTKNIPHWIDKGVYKEENFNTICTNDFAPALERLGERIGDRIVGSLGTFCLDPPGLTQNGGIICRKGDVIYEDKTKGTKAICQQDCLTMTDLTITEVSSTIGGSEIKKCSDTLFDTAKYPNGDQCGSECPCWRVVSSRTCLNNSGSSPYAVEIMRQGESPKGTYAQVCALVSQHAWNTEEFSKLPQCQ